jgi:hypothetical protein
MTSCSSTVARQLRDMKGGGELGLARKTTEKFCARAHIFESSVSDDGHYKL